MKSVHNILWLALGAVAVLVPQSALAQSSGVQIWSQRCGVCHEVQPANRYTAEKWESIVTHMELTARLTSEQSRAVLKFLKSGARKVAMQEVEGPKALQVASLGGLFLPGTIDGEEVFAANCVACHGKSGEGNGPAAVAFDPPPSDLTDPEGVKTKSAEELVHVITAGKGGMPAFGATLSAEELEAVAEYVRKL